MSYPRTIRVLDDIFDKWATRSARGWLVSVRWGEPEADGTYSPIFTETDDGMCVVPRSLLDAVKDICEPTYWDDDQLIASVPGSKLTTLRTELRAL